MPRGAFNLAVDIVAVNKAVGAVQSQHTIRQQVMEFIGRREPIGLDFGQHIKCWQCCNLKGTWWRQNAIKREAMVVDDVRKEVYTVEEIEFSDLDDDFGWGAKRNKRRGLSLSDDSLSDLDDDGDEDEDSADEGGRRVTAKERAAIEALLFPLDDPEISSRTWGLHYLRNGDKEIDIEDTDEVLRYATCCEGKVYLCTGAEPYPVILEYDPPTAVWRTFGAGPPLQSDFDVIRNYEGKLQYAFGSASEYGDALYLVDEEGDVRSRFASGEPVRMVRFITPTVVCVMDCCIGIEFVLMRLDAFKKRLSSSVDDSHEKRDEQFFRRKFESQVRVLAEREAAQEKKSDEKPESDTSLEDEAEGEELFCLRYGPLENYEYRVSPCGHVIAVNGPRGDIGVVYQ
ncbi:hypothetical protein FOZ62_022132 [Perkinsus olseni]|uniref:Uncharacterized protein n=1 Tax=Perkinsus olseni TaxID=32597 RepID=A0A7J6N3D4_PEROL|nr:hypothetical protein FOZ62_022132 [Perkinsus olseni]